jgi:hypothetical protein
MVDVGVGPEQQVLDDEQVGVGGHVPGRLPAAGHRPLAAPGAQVVAGEGVGQRLHPRPVLEPPVPHVAGDVLGDAHVEGGEVPAGVLRRQGHAPQLLDRRVDHPV